MHSIERAYAYLNKETLWLLVLIATVMLLIVVTLMQYQRVTSISLNTKSTVTTVQNKSSILTVPDLTKQLNQWRIFGVPPKQSQVRQQYKDWQVTGIFMATLPADRQAIIQRKNGQSHLVNIGDQVKGAGRVIHIEKDFVDIDSDEGRIRLSIQFDQTGNTRKLPQTEPVQPQVDPSRLSPMQRFLQRQRLQQLQQR